MVETLDGLRKVWSLHPSPARLKKSRVTLRGGKDRHSDRGAQATIGSAIRLSVTSGGAQLGGAVTRTQREHGSSWFPGAEFRPSQLQE